MKIAIIAAMEEECALLRSRLTEASHKNYYQMQISTGLLDGVPVVLTQCGIGKVNAAMATTTIINTFSPRAVINTGCAGGLVEHLKQGDVVIANDVAHHDVDVTAFGYTHGQVPQQPPHYPADLRLLNTARMLANKLQKLIPQHRLYEGLITSGDQFICGQECKKKILKNFPKAVALEMEAAAIAQVCHSLHTPYLMVRSISDNGDEAAGQEFKTFVKLASENSANITQMLVTQFYAVLRDELEMT